MLVQFGSSSDSAFSWGESLFLVKDQIRLTLFRLSDGKLIAHLRGERRAASAAANLLVLNEGGSKLGFYDLSTGGKLAERQLSDGPAYLRFSEKGDRLILTTHQEVMVLDVKKLLQTYAIPATESH